MNIINDNSSQVITSLANVSNLYNPFITSNELFIGLATKQDTLTAGTTLLGVGSSISALDYSKITLNLPTYFPTSWANVASKPATFPADMTTIYNKSEIDTFLNTKQPNLSFSTPLLNTNNTISINLNSYPNFTALNSCNFITNSTSGLTNYPSYTVLNSCNYDTIALRNTTLNSYPNFTTLNSCNYITNATNGLINYPSFTVLNSCNYDTIALRNTTLNSYPNFTTLNSCNYITNATNGLTNYPSFTVLNSCNYITNATNGLTNYYNKTTSDGRFAILANNNTFAGDVIINGTLKKLSFGSRIEDFLIYLWGTLYGLGVNASTFRLNAPADASYKFYTGTTNTMTLNNAGVLSTTGGITLTGSAKFTGDGSGLTNLPLSAYSTTTVNDGKYLKLDGTNTMTGDFRVYNGKGQIRGATTYTNISTSMINGSLVIGDTSQNFGGGTGWNTNTAGLLMECLDNTEIAIHDNGIRIASFMRYVGGSTNQFYIGRDMGFGAIAQTNFYGNVSIDNSLYFKTNVWNYSSDNQKRIYCENNSTTYFGTGGALLAYVFRNPADNIDLVKIDTSGSIRSVKGIYANGSDGFYLPITTGNYWNIQTGSTPTGVINSLIFYHGAIGINSYWWLNGTQTATQSEISDERIKKNIKPINSSNALTIINKLQPKSFNLMDDKDDNFKYGFISQEVEKIPELEKLIFKTTDFICNINSYGNYNKNIIKANNNISGLVNVDDNIKIVLNNNNPNNQEFELDGTPYKNRYKRRYLKVIEIIDDYSFIVDKEFEKNEEIFIYGKEVEDFKHLDYQSFHALNTSAIQELYKIINKQQEQINLLLSYRNV